MRLRGKLLKDVEPEDIRALVTDEVSESVELDYKDKVPGPKSERNDLVEDAAALANTRGGVLLLGIAERVENGKKTGVPEKITGVGPIATDHELRRLEQTIRDLTDPQLTGCHAQAFTMDTGEVVVGIGVPRSLLAPHAAGGRYFRRGTTGNYPVETRELHQMFLQRDQWSRDIEEFRRARVETIGREFPDLPGLKLSRDCYLHILPIGRLDEITNIVAKRRDLVALEPLSQAHWPHRPNLDGYISYGPSAEKCTRYVQWFRFGGVEVCTSRHRWTGQDGTKGIEAGILCANIFHWTRTAIRFMHETMALDPPYAILLSLIATQGASVDTERWKHLLPEDCPNVIEEPHLILPAMVVEDAEADVEGILMGAFDMIWQAAGFPDCPLRRARPEWKDAG